nr:rho GTPase-activating protein 30-like [Paramormyrops kingsleyae]XP_023646872.1 rho GTPase-activating protein 30-like [Paramormyrops kingsleyae]
MRRGKRKAGNRDKVFGCDLLEHLAASSQEIPLVLRYCSEFIEEHGVVDGIYRLSGVSSNTQKLRTEFDEGSPDLNKEVYLQDIHCVSSLCKAYFRELPNPLLMYQLYDKFAEAVSIHLEDERLVKIKDVLKELPTPHYRTLEYLMRHLVRMAAHSSQTNMHARNLAIVWAPNLLRSKDIEASGFNGTAAFMEVRVQSVVVEFILTHVAQLFPEEGNTGERRQSLPSPAFACIEDKISPSLFAGTISPGDGPLPMRPYHTIIDEKRKGSLKSRKWTSIFNLGSRLNEKKHKCSRKEKEKSSLRPAKSMDSLSSPSQEGHGKRPDQCLLSSPSQQLTVTPGGGESGGLAASTGGMGSSYAVTYRRGGGASVSMVSGGGTPGTYSRLDSGGGLATVITDRPIPRSPAANSRAERRAGIHISGPFSVTVPLHITSGLALGVLQGAAGEKAEEPGGQRGEDREQGGKEKRVEPGESQQQARKGEQEGKGGGDGEKDLEEGEATSKDGRRSRKDGEEGEARRQGAEEQIERAVNGVSVEERPSKAGGERRKEGSEGEGRSDAGQPAENKEEQEDDEEQEYMDMKGSIPLYDDSQDLPLDFQDTFGFLDVLDNMTSNQVNEFSVEPPCYDTEEEEDLRDEEKDQQVPSLSCQELEHLPEEAIESNPPTELDKEDTETPVQLRQKNNQLGFPPHNRACKSQSLPYKAGLFLQTAINFNEEYDDDDDDDDDDDESEDDEGSEEDDNEDDQLFFSLPSSMTFRSQRQEDMEHSVTQNIEDGRTSQLGPAGGDGTGLSPSAEDLEAEVKERTMEPPGSGPAVDAEAAETAVDHDEVEGEEGRPEQAEKTEQGDPAIETHRQREEEECQAVGVRSEEEEDSCDVRGTPSRSEDSQDHMEAPDEAESGSQVNTVQEKPEATQANTERDDSEGCCQCVDLGDSTDGTPLEEEALSLGVEPTTPPGTEDVSPPGTPSELPPLSPNSSEMPPEDNVVKEGTIAVSEDAMAGISTEGREACLPSENVEERPGSSTEMTEQGEREVATDREGEGEEGEEGEEGGEAQISDDMQEQQDSKETHVDSSGQDDNDYAEMIETDGLSEVADTEEEHNESEINKNIRETNKEIKDGGEEWRESMEELKVGQDEKSERATEVELGLLRTLVVSKQVQPKVYHAKAVPVVPPKPQLSKLAALNLRQQQLQRESKRGKEGEWQRDRDKDRNREGQGSKEVDREVKRNSPISMYFDQAVAMATERRGREMEDREREREKERGMDEECETEEKGTDGE